MDTMTLDSTTLATIDPQALELVTGGFLSLEGGYRSGPGGTQIHGGINVDLFGYRARLGARYESTGDTTSFNVEAGITQQQRS